MVYFNQNKNSKALQSSKRSLTIAEKVGAVIEKRSAAKSLWEINKRLGRHEESLKMYELYITTRDEILSEENQKEIMRQGYEYEYEKQAATDSIIAVEELLVAKAEKNQIESENDKQRQQGYFLIGSLVLALLFGGFIFNRFRVTKG
jgi:hypothetical protein